MATQVINEKIPHPIGDSVPRVDAYEKVIGAALFADDIQFGPGLLYARIKRSPHPHALIKRIDVSKALALPGVKAVVTGEDSPASSACTCRTGTSSAASGCAMWATRSPAWRRSAKRSPRRRWS